MCHNYTFFTKLPVALRCITVDRQITLAVEPVGVGSPSSSKNLILEANLKQFLSLVTTWLRSRVDNLPVVRKTVL